MRRDLRKLSMTYRELNDLTGIQLGRDQVSVNDLSLKDFVIYIMGAFLLFFLSEFLLDNGIIAIILGIFPLYILFDRMIHSSVFATSFDSEMITDQPSMQYLKALLEDVERYNKVVKTLDIMDQLQEAGNPGMEKGDRTLAIEALKLAREDLIRALKTERILRENRDFLEGEIIANSDLFVNNLSSLNAIALEHEATELGQVLDSVLQIATHVKVEMQKLQSVNHKPL